MLLLLFRVTSGLVVLARTKDAAAEISKTIRQKGTQKVYFHFDYVVKYSSYFL